MCCGDILLVVLVVVAAATEVIHLTDFVVHKPCPEKAGSLKYIACCATLHTSSKQRQPSARSWSECAKQCVEHRPLCMCGWHRLEEDIWKNAWLAIIWSCLTRQTILWVIWWRTTCLKWDGIWPPGFAWQVCTYFSRVVLEAWALIFTYLFVVDCIACGW